MSEEQAAAAETTKAKKTEPEKVEVEMTDGRKVTFVGNRNLNKDGKVEEDGGICAVFDFRNGESSQIRLAAGDPLILRLAVHGLLQKGGDEAAGVKFGKDHAQAGQPDVDSMSMGVDNILKRLANTEATVEDRWSAERTAGDGFSGAAVVVRALCEVTKRDVAWVKEFLEKKLTAGKEAGLTRQKMYQAFRAPGSKTAPVIERLEREKLSGKPAIDPNEFLDEMAMPEA